MPSTVLPRSVRPPASRSSTRKVASNTFASPLTRARVAEARAPRRPVHEDGGQLVAEVVPPDRLVEHDPLAPEGSHGYPVELEPDAGDSGELGERVRHLAEPCLHRGTAPRRDSNSFDRFTVATPSAIEIPRRVVPSGIAVYIAGLAAISASSGPASSARIAAVATALVCGHLAEHRGEALVASEAAEHEVGAHDRRAGARRRRGGGGRARTSGLASGEADAPGDDDVDGAGVAVGSGLDKSGGRVTRTGPRARARRLPAGPRAIPSEPTDGEHPAMSAATRRRAGMVAKSGHDPALGADDGTRRGSAPGRVAAIARQVTIGSQGRRGPRSGHPRAGFAPDALPTCSTGSGRPTRRGAGRAPARRAWASRSPPSTRRSSAAACGHATGPGAA